MRTIKYIVLLSAFLATSAAYAEQGEFDIGIAAISPNGFTAKYWTSDTTAFDIFGEWSFNSNEYLMHADILVHDFNKIQLEDMRIAFYYGGGVRVKFADNSDDSLVGVRIPFGLDYFLNELPIEFYGELAPRVNVYPDTHFGMDVIVGIRYRFI
jgi:uncharacterized protein (DUF433 family)